MSIQHRARIKTVADYSQYLSDMGGCCLPDAGPNDAFEASYQDCITQDGYFIPSEGPWTCPDLSIKGCCCSCSYVDDFEAFFNASGCNGPCGTNGYDDCYNGGLREVTECECRAVGGIWAGSGTSCSVYDGSGSSNAYTLCNSVPNLGDVRFPGACCIGDTDDECQNKCSSDECAEVAGTDGVFYELHVCHSEQVCDREVAPCQDTVARRAGNRDRRTGLLVVSDDDRTLNQKRVNIAKTEINHDSACIHRDKNNNLICSNETKRRCGVLNGVWSGLDGSGFPHTCSSSTVSDITNYIKNNRTISEGTASSWELGKSYLGLNARYAGIIYSKSRVKGKGSEYWGNLNTGQAEESQIVSNTTNISSGTSYAVFVHNQNEKRSSKGVSSYLSSISTTYFKFTVPDLETLGFLYKSIRNAKFIKNSQVQENDNCVWNPFSELPEDYYLTSTHLKINGRRDKKFVHVQNMDSGFTSTCSTNKLMPIKSVLLIPLT